MIQKFRSKITILLISIFLVFIVGILFSVNLYNYSANQKEVEKSLKIQIRKPRIPNASNKPLEPTRNEKPEEPEMQPPMGPEIEPEIAQNDDFRKSYVYFVRVKSDGTIIPYDLKEDSKYTEKEIIDIAKNIIKEDKIRGIYDQFQYLLTDVEEERVVSFADISSFQRQQYKMLRYSLFIGIFVLMVLAEVSVILSRWLVKPLKEAFEKQKQFIAAAGHELKTPLAVMKISLDTIKSEGQGGKYVDYALEESAKMTALLHEMLTLSSMEKTYPDMKRERIDLGKVVEGASLPFEVMAYEKGIDFQLEIEPEIYIFADSDMIQQLVGIFVDNAIHHTMPSKKVIVYLKKENGKACLEVKNEGEPIPESEKKKIFESFYRMDKSRNRQEGRYGLGLSIAWKIAESFESKIQVDYRDGYTVFGVKFTTVK